MTVTDLDSTLALVADVDGWMTDGQGAALFDAAASCPPNGRIVEIGSFRGRSTIVLATAADPTVEIVAIDPHAGNDRGPEEIEGFEAEADDDHTVFNANLAAAGVANAEIADFEDLALTPASYWNGSDASGGFASGSAYFNNNYNADWGSWDGFAYSNSTDTTTDGPAAQYNAITGAGQGGSANYGICYVGWTSLPVLTLSSCLTAWGI